MGRGHVSSCQIFGDAHDPALFVSASRKEYHNWRPEKPRIVNRHERMRPQISTDGYGWAAELGTELANPRNRVPTGRMEELRVTAAANAEQRQKPRQMLGSLADPLRNPYGAAGADLYMSAYAKQCAARRVGSARGVAEAPPAGRLGGKARQWGVRAEWGSAAHDPLTGLPRRLTGAAWERPGATQARGSVNSRCASAQRRGEQPATSLVGGPADAHAGARGRRRPPREAVGVAAPTVPDFVTSAR